jgi:DUF4097 and DUF4098 domain-containing protein YvlB
VAIPVQYLQDFRAVSVSGDVLVLAVDADSWDIVTTSGDITIKELEVDRIKVVSVSGKVVIEQETVSGDYDIKTVSGNIALNLDEQSDFRLDYAAISGNIETDYVFDQIIEFDSNDAELISGSGNYLVKVRSTSGDLNLK